MSTLADELLQDFEDSGSENGERVEDDGEDDTAAIMGLTGGDVPMDDTDLVSSDDDDDAMGGVDDHEAKGKADKNGKSNDLRSATSLVKTLDSILEVRDLAPYYAHRSRAVCGKSNRDTAFTSVLPSLLREKQQP